MKIKELQLGDFFTKNPTEHPRESQVWVRGEYDRSERKYECWKFGDINHTAFMKGDLEVHTDFVF